MLNWCSHDAQQQEGRAGKIIFLEVFLISEHKLLRGPSVHVMPSHCISLEQEECQCPKSSQAWPGTAWGTPECWGKYQDSCFR